jgi:VanZ family protein
MTSRSNRSPLAQALSAVSLLGPAVVYTIGLFYIGSLRIPPPPGPTYSDKVWHALVFGFFVPVVARALSFLVPRARFSLRTWLAVGLSSATGALLEMWQYFLPYRSCEFMDWVADTVGALVVASIIVAVLWAAHFRPLQGAPPSA